MNMQLIRERMVQPHRVRVWPGNRNRITNAAVRMGTMAMETTRVVVRTRSSRTTGSDTGVCTPYCPAPLPSVTGANALFGLPPAVQRDQLVLDLGLELEHAAQAR